MKRKATERGNRSVEFLGNAPRLEVNTIETYCESIEIEPDQLINETVIKDLFYTHRDFEYEKYIYRSNKLLTIKKALKTFFQF